MFFISANRIFSFITYLIFSDFFSHVRKQLQKKAEAIFKLHDITNWEANYYNTYTTEYL